MTRRLCAWAGAAGLALLAGCATRYAEPPPSAPAATLTIAHQGKDFPSWTTVTVFDNGGCQASPASGRIGTVGKAYDLSEKPQSTRVRARQPLHVSVQGTSSSAVSVTGVNGPLTRYTCTSLVSFTPEAGRAYTVSQRVYAPGRCKAVVTDDATQAPPPDLVQPPTPAACESNGP